MTTLQQEINKQSSLNGYIELFTVDSTNIGGGDVFHFTTQVTEHDTRVVYQGITYQPFPVEVEGFTKTGTGSAPPQPTLTTSNVGGLLMSAVIRNNDLVGAMVKRLVTFRNFLDDGSEPDPNAHFPVDFYFVEQIEFNKQYLKLTLRTPLDRARQLPRRQILRDKGFPGAGLFSGQFG